MTDTARRLQVAGQLIGPHANHAVWGRLALRVVTGG